MGCECLSQLENCKHMAIPHVLYVCEIALKKETIMKKGLLLSIPLLALAVLATTSSLNAQLTRKELEKRYSKWPLLKRKIFAAKKAKAVDVTAKVKKFKALYDGARAMALRAITTKKFAQANLLLFRLHAKYIKDLLGNVDLEYTQKKLDDAIAKVFGTGQNSKTIEKQIVLFRDQALYGLAPQKPKSSK